MSHVIPKRKVAVRIRLTSGEGLEGEVFLDFIDPVHRGDQTLLDMLNKDALWFPVATAAGVQVVNRFQVLTVEPGDGVEVGLVRRDSSAVFRRERVSLEIGDRTVTGQIAMDLPDEFSRVSDFLNFPQNFFALETDHGPRLVAKRHVLSLRALEAPPAAPGREPGVQEHL